MGKFLSSVAIWAEGFDCGLGATTWHIDFLRLGSIQALLLSISFSVTTTEFHIFFLSKSEPVIQKFSTIWQIVHFHNPVDVGFSNNFQTIIPMMHI